MKRIENEINKIKKFLEKEVFVIIHQEKFPINDCKITLNKNPENNFIDYNIQLKEIIFPPSEITFNKVGLNNSFVIKSDNNKYIIPLKSSTSPRIKKMGLSENLLGEITSIYSENFPTNSDSYFRSVMKIKDDGFVTIFLGSEYTCEKTQYGLGLIELKFDDLEYQVFRHRAEKEYYLIIECLNKTDLQAFENYNELILKSLGLLTGHWYQNEHFIFSYNSSNFTYINSIYYKNLEDSIITNHELINPQEFRSFLRANGDENAKLTPQLFPEKTLSLLVFCLKTNPEIERTIDLLIKGNSIESSIIRCSIFHVALETIVGLIHKQNKKLFEPIKSVESLTELKEDFQSLLDNKKHLFSELDFSIISKKIEYLNTPFNKDIFLLAFEFYKIDLPEWLKKMLSTRNKFLHGKTPFKEEHIKTRIKELNLYADRIHLLTSILILKYAGYRGHIKNHAAYSLRMEEHYSEKEFEKDLGQNDNVYYKI